jgi:hypothetical protein
MVPRLWTAAWKYLKNNDYFEDFGMCSTPLLDTYIRKTSVIWHKKMATPCGRKVGQDVCVTHAEPEDDNLCSILEDYPLPWSLSPVRGVVFSMHCMIYTEGHNGTRGREEWHLRWEPGVVRNTNSTKAAPESIQCNIEDKAFSPSYDLVTPHPLSHPLSGQKAWPAIHRETENERQLADGEGGGEVEGSSSYDGDKAWFSIKNWILCAAPIMSTARRSDWGRLI